MSDTFAEVTLDPHTRAKFAVACRRCPGGYVMGQDGTPRTYRTANDARRAVDTHHRTGHL